MDTFEFSVPGRLPSLNDYIRWNRANKYVGNKAKREAQARIAEAIGENPPRFDQKGLLVEFEWWRDDRRTDKDNVAFAKKFVLDALQETGVIPSDRWDWVTPLDVRFGIDRENPRTVVRVRDMGAVTLLGRREKWS